MPDEASQPWQYRGDMPNEDSIWRSQSQSLAAPDIGVRENYRTNPILRFIFKALSVLIGRNEVHLVDNACRILKSHTMFPPRIHTLSDCVSLRPVIMRLTESDVAICLLPRGTRSVTNCDPRCSSRWSVKRLVFRYSFLRWMVGRFWVSPTHNNCRDLKESDRESWIFPLYSVASADTNRSGVGRL